MSLRSVPKLNLLDFLSEDVVVKNKFIDDLYQSCVEYGFVVFSNHTISNELLDRAYLLQKELFALPLSAKNEFILNNNGQRGYTPFGIEHAKGNNHKDLKEFWHIGREDSTHLQNVWVENLPEFKEVFTQIYSELDRTGLLILKALTHKLDVEEDFFEKMTDNGNSVLRLLHYPPINNPSDKQSIRAAAHTDINLITLLVSGTTGGLELLDSDKKWIPVESNKNSIVMNIGDMLSRICNNQLKSTVHRVVNPENSENVSRYSMPFFLHPKNEAVLEELPIFHGIGKSHKTITAGDFLKLRLKEIGLK